MWLAGIVSWRNGDGLKTNKVDCPPNRGERPPLTGKVERTKRFQVTPQS